MSNIFTTVITLSRDGEVRHTPNGKVVLSVNGACNTGFGDRKQTLWLACSLWGPRAEGTLVDYCKKGGKVWVSGELTVREYDKDGQTKVAHELNCSIFELVGGGNNPNAVPRPTPPSPPGKPESNRTPYQDQFDDDIPFS